MENKILYTKLSSDQANLLIDKIYETLLESVTNGKVLFEETQLSERYNIKGVKWDISLTIIK